MQIFLFLIVIFFANVIQAITGFAGTVLAMPPSILLIGMDSAKVVLTVMAFLSCLLISVQNREFIDKVEAKKIITFMIVGMIIGTFLYQYAPADILLFLYGILIVLIGIQKLCSKKELQYKEITLTIILFLAGIIHGLFVSGGALLVIYATNKFPTKEIFRATISTIWVVLNVLLMISYQVEGLITSSNLLLIVYSIPLLILATYVGTKLQQKMNQSVFLKLTYILLIISGCSILI